MPSLSQLLANQHNAQFSTGPRTESGKANSSRNALTLGLYTRTDYVKPEERDLYKEFCETMYSELCPASLLEETLVSEITGASWRLRRCDAADAGLDFDESTDKLRRSVERARASATSILHRGINQLRKLQSGHAARAASPQVPELASNCITAPDPIPDLDRLTQPPPEFLEELDAILAEYAALGSNCKPAPAQAPELASICKPAPQIPRSAPCPCKSGEKYKRCCGKNAPPVLGKAA
jgi:hypothetical protein